MTSKQAVILILVSGFWLIPSIAAYGMEKSYQIQEHFKHHLFWSRKESWICCVASLWGVFSLRHALDQFAVSHYKLGWRLRVPKALRKGG